MKHKHEQTRYIKSASKGLVKNSRRDRIIYLPSIFLFCVYFSDKMSYQYFHAGLRHYQDRGI